VSTVMESVKEISANISRKISRWDEGGVLIALMVLIVTFGTINHEFLTPRTWGTIFTFASVLGIIALGATILMVAGEFDLSVGSVCALSGMLFAMGTVNGGYSTYLLLPAVILLGAALGLLNGWVTLKTGIPSFITTLGTMLIWRGAVLGMTGGFSISLVDARSGVMTWFGQDLGEGLYSAVLWWVGLALLLHWLLAFTPTGNHLLATGGNEKAARGQGVNTTKIKLVAFTLSGVLAALSGVVLFSQLQDLSPTAGESYELYAIASAVIGGTLLTGGAGTIVGTLLGTLLIGVVQAGLVHAGIDSYWFRGFVGLLLVLSVIMNLRIKRWRESL
jgi:simple sugar transport system permease protein